MRNLIRKTYLFSIVLFSFVACKNTGEEQPQTKLTKVDGAQLSYILPSPNTDGAVSVESAMAKRRSQRNYVDRPISAEQLSQILWAAYGVTEQTPDRPNIKGGLRTTPSAGALYPFEIYAIVSKVNGIEAGAYRYDPIEHKIIRVIDKDIREEFSAAAVGSVFIKDAPVILFYSAIFSRMTVKYGDRGRDRYVCMDLGHSAQNVYLQAEAMNLGTCAIGAFSDNRISRLMQLAEDEEPLYIMPIGYYYK